VEIVVILDTLRPATHNLMACVPYIPGHDRSQHIAAWLRTVGENPNRVNEFVAITTTVDYIPPHAFRPL
jgi:hypothetical protein